MRSILRRVVEPELLAPAGTARCVQVGSHHVQPGAEPRHGISCRGVTRRRRPRCRGPNPPGMTMPSPQSTLGQQPPDLLGLDPLIRPPGADGSRRACRLDDQRGRRREFILPSEPMRRLASKLHEGLQRLRSGNRSGPSNRASPQITVRVLDAARAGSLCARDSLTPPRHVAEHRILRLSRQMGRCCGTMPVGLIRDCAAR
jgi:hypothetical protein